MEEALSRYDSNWLVLYITYCKIMEFGDGLICALLALKLSHKFKTIVKFQPVY